MKIPLSLVGPRVVASSLACLVLISCASNPKTKPESDDPKSIQAVIENRGKNADPYAAGTRNPRDITIQGVKLKTVDYDIPIVINSAVEDWVSYFTGRGRVHFERYLERSEYFIPYIDPILKSEGMPRDLVYLAMIESGFNNLARSRAKAVGPWQFMAATGKRYGLGVNWWVDERRDIRKSTLAAAEYLRELYNMFQSWELSAAAYNAGENKVARAIQRYGSRDFWTLARHRYLRAETRNYVPKMMAAALLAKNREQFGFKAARHKWENDEVLASDGEIVKVVKSDNPTRDASDGLEAILKSADGTTVKPVDDSDFEDEDEDDGTASQVQSAAAAPSGTPEDGKNPRAIAVPHVNKEGDVGGSQVTEFDIQSPADVLMIARAAGLSYQTVKALNPELLRWCTPPHQKNYRLKLPAAVREKFLSTYNHPAFPRQVKFLTYTVKRGETLSRIARYFGINPEPVSDLNGISAGLPLRNGMKIRLPIPNDRSRSLASLEVRDPAEKSSRKRQASKRGKKSSRGMATAEKRAKARVQY